MTMIKMKDIPKNTFLVLLGTLIFTIGINSIIIPNNLGEGGMTGVTLLLFYIWGIAPSISNFVINAILLILGWKLLEKETIIYTLLSIVSMSLFLEWITLPPFIPTNTLLAPLLSGVMIGVGIGVVVLGHGTTAGSDIIALIMNKNLGLSMGGSLFIIDLFILVPLTWIVGIEKGVMTMVSILVAIKVLDFVIEGYNPKKALMIISDQHEAVAKAIMMDVNRGITVLRGYGYYSKSDKEVLYVIINRIQLMKVQRLINEIDPKAFVTVTGIQQVIGEGFTFHVEKTSSLGDKEII